MSKFSTTTTTSWRQLAKQNLSHLAHALGAKITPWNEYFSQQYKTGPAWYVWHWVLHTPWVRIPPPPYEILRVCAAAWIQEDAKAYFDPQAPLTPEARLWLSVWASWWLIRPTLDGGCQMPPEVVREILPDLRLAAARVAQMVEEAERLAAPAAPPFPQAPA